jgi:hypothetical protein
LAPATTPLDAHVRPQAEVHGTSARTGQPITAWSGPHVGVAQPPGAATAPFARISAVPEIRLHDTPLYNSIYRFDDELLVNVHVYGLLAAYTPTLRVRRIDGQFFNTYLESFERVWASARPPGPDLENS